MPAYVDLAAQQLHAGTGPLAPAVVQDVGYDMTLRVWLIFVAVATLMSCVVWLMTSVLGRSGPKPKAPAPAAAPTPKAAAQGAARTAGGHDPKHVAAIVAAVSAVFEEGAVIVHIEPSATEGSWTNEVRNAHHLSHSPSPSRW